jgi:hypothetical protein
VANIFVQIGLNDHLDFHYLANPYFKTQWENLERKKFRCHESLLDVSEPYHVVGVDIQSDKNKRIREKHADNPRIHIFDNAIWCEDITELPHGTTAMTDDYHGSRTNFSYSRISEAITLQTLFSRIHQIPGLEEGVIRCVHTNIEYAEIDMIKGINWDTFEKPDVMRIATRHGRNPELDAAGHAYCLRVLHENGYMRDDTKFDKEEYVTFIRERSY